MPSFCSVLVLTLLTFLEQCQILETKLQLPKWPLGGQEGTEVALPDNLFLCKKLLFEGSGVIPQLKDKMLL
jgi:hypothetical protein